MNTCPKCGLATIKLYSGKIGCAIHGPIEAKGSATSGDYGHAGRPGERGGSAPGRGGVDRSGRDEIDRIAAARAEAAWVHAAEQLRDLHRQHYEAAATGSGFDPKTGFLLRTVEQEKEMAQKVRDLVRAAGDQTGMRYQIRPGDKDPTSVAVYDTQTGERRANYGPWDAATAVKTRDDLNKLNPKAARYDAKGDVAGHAFHGNQYTMGQGGPTISRDQIAHELGVHSQQEVSIHTELHSHAKSRPRTSEALRQHLEQRHGVPAKDMSYNEMANMHWKMPHEDWHRATEVGDTKDCPKCGLVMVKLYTGKIGCAIHGAPEVKGDSPGHPFRGNQFTSGSDLTLHESGLHYAAAVAREAIAQAIDRAGQRTSGGPKTPDTIKPDYPRPRTIHDLELHLENDHNAPIGRRTDRVLLEQAHQLAHSAYISNHDHPKSAEVEDAKRGGFGASHPVKP